MCDRQRLARASQRFGKAPRLRIGRGYRIEDIRVLRAAATHRLLRQPDGLGSVPKGCLRAGCQQPRHPRQHRRIAGVRAQYFPPMDQRFRILPKQVVVGVPRFRSASKKSGASSSARLKWVMASSVRRFQAKAIPRFVCTSGDRGSSFSASR